MTTRQQEEAIHEVFSQYLRDLREFTAKEKTEHTRRGRGVYTRRRQQGISLSAPLTTF